MGLTRGDLGIPSVHSACPSVHQTGSGGDAKSDENTLMMLEIWVNGSLEIMKMFFSSYVEKFGCYGNK
jgi:hypothetical protein